KIGNPEPSIVLQAIGLSSNLSLGSLRLSIGRNTNQDQVNYVITMLPKIISKMRGTP
ncbi:MAG TPA: cysteine desulfurase NifS, partial [Chloroflexi bacterium]|nr:cysteine desulfurase NifS [Chloroflexota bacterium]